MDPAASIVVAPDLPVGQSVATPAGRRQILMVMATGAGGLFGLIMAAALTGLTQVIMACASGGLVVWALVIAVHTKRVGDRAGLATFAKANGFVFARKAPVTPHLIEKSRGWDQAQSVVTGTLLGLPLVIYQHLYEASDGSHTKTAGVTILTIELPTSLPSTLVSASNRVEFATDLAISLGEHTVVRADSPGISLCSPKEYEVEALQLYSPELLTQLSETLGAAVIETDQHSVVISLQRTDNLTGALRQLLMLAGVMITHVNNAGYISVTKIGDIEPRFSPLSKPFWR